MSIQKNIGKNTIGDNNKMSVSLHEYNMSTHEIGRASCRERVLRLV